jgi:hypothetical protein
LKATLDVSYLNLREENAITRMSNQRKMCRMI